MRGTEPRAVGDAMLAMEKHRADDAAYEYHSPGGGIRVPLLSRDKRESFFLTSPGARSSSPRGRIRIEHGASRFSLGSTSWARLIEPDDEEIRTGCFMIAPFVLNELARKRPECP